jgi:hypothetical protein
MKNMKFARMNRAAWVLAALAVCPLHAGIGLLQADAYVSSGSPTTNFGAVTVLNVGGSNASLIQFDLSMALSQLVGTPVPSSDTPVIGRATLKVYANRVTSPGTLNVAPLSSSWTESTVTFNTAPAPGGVVGSASLSTSAQFVQVDITSLVQSWLNGTVANNGLYLSSPDGGVFVFDSKEATTTSHQAQLDIDLATDFTGVITKQMTLNAPGFASLFSFNLSGTNVAGARIFYTIRATDGGSQIATESGVMQTTSTTNSITCTVSSDDKLHLGTVNSGCTPGFFNPGSHPGVSIFDNVSFSTPAPIVVHEVAFRIINMSGAAIRLEP